MLSAELSLYAASDSSSLLEASDDPSHVPCAEIDRGQFLSKWRIAACRFQTALRFFFFFLYWWLIQGRGALSQTHRYEVKESTQE
jgi:hypothetical protein